MSSSDAIANRLNQYRTMRLIKLYVKLTHDEIPENQIFYAEWYSRYIEWLETRLFAYEFK